MHFLFVGICGSLLAGSMMPVFAFALARMINAFNIENFDTVADQKDEAETWILVLVFSGLAILFVFFF